jgi:O-antigen ligase
MSTLRFGTPAGAAGVAWLILGIVACVPWVISPAGHPWAEFTRNLAQAVVWLACALGVAWCAKTPWALPRSAMFLVALATVPLAQLALGLFIYAGEAFVVAAVLIGLAAAVAVAAHSQRNWPLRLGDTLFGAIAVAALANVALASLQWLHWDALGTLLNGDTVAGRAAANIGQANLLATLLLWGMVGVSWLHWRGHLKKPLFLGAIGIFLFGVLLTQSRTGAVGVGVLALFACRSSLAARLKLPRRTLLVMLLAFVALTLVWPALNNLFNKGTARSVAEAATVGKRPAIWSIMTDAVAQQPWFGYGWNQGTQAQMAVVEKHPSLHVLNQNAHNLFLDLLVWNGVPLGALLTLVMIVWFVRRLRQANDPAAWLLMAAVSVFMLHAMLELPHMALVFAVPMALMIGTLEAISPNRPAWHMRPLPMLAVLTLLAFWLARMAVEYTAVESDLRAHRMILARIGDLTPPQPPKPLLLGYLQEALAAQRIEPSPVMTPADRAALERSATRYPSVGSLLRAAQAAALNGDPVRAGSLMRRLCLINEPDVCQDAWAAWVEIGKTRYPQLGQVIQDPR